MNTITGRSAFLALLEDEGVTHLFGNPGTTELPIMDALPEHPGLRYVLGLQEGVVLSMADGFARATRRLAACNVHVAPGLGNAMGALYNASWCGSPVLVTAGQQEQGHGLTEPLLYGPLVEMASPLCKWAIEVTRLADLPRIVRRAAKVALAPPTGPVFLSLPGDILNDRAALDLGRATRVDASGRPSDRAIERLARRLLAARRPAIICGHEVVAADAWAEAADLSERIGAPVYQQTVPHGAHFPSEHPAFMGSLGREQASVRAALAPHDLLVCVGADVLCMSVWSDIEPMPEGLPLVQIGLADWEMGKNYPAEIALRADVGETLRALLPVLSRLAGEDYRARAAERLEALGSRNWSARRKAEGDRARGVAAATPIDPAWLMLALVEAIPPDAVVVDEGLVTSRPLQNLYPFRDRDAYYGLASGGIGFAVGGAIGISLAHPERRVVAIIGDGSAMYGVQALWTAAHLDLPITYVIANNRGYRILKERIVAYGGRESFTGMELCSPDIDFAGLAESLGVPARRVMAPDEIGDTMREALERPGPMLLDVAVAEGF